MECRRRWPLWGIKMQIRQATPARTGWTFWLLLIITIAVLAAENFGHFSLSVPTMLKASGGLPILDMRPWYTPAEAYQLFDALGPAGRTANRLLYLTVDLTIPLLITMLLWAAISRGVLRRFRAFALLGGAFDYLENISILILLARYPEHVDSLVVVATCFTVLKFVFYGVGTIIALTGFFIMLFRSQTRDNLTT
jgi:hypothetical protein